MPSPFVGIAFAFVGIAFAFVGIALTFVGIAFAFVGITLAFVGIALAFVGITARGAGASGGQQQHSEARNDAHDETVPRRSSEVERSSRQRLWSWRCEPWLGKGR
jgi:hypothetical protein